MSINQPINGNVSRIINYKIPTACQHQHAKTSARVADTGNKKMLFVFYDLFTSLPGCRSGKLVEKTT